MEKFRTALNKALELLAGLSMAVMVILTTYQVIARYIFNSPSTWSEELGSLIVLVGDGGHISDVTFRNVEIFQDATYAVNVSLGPTDWSEGDAVGSIQNILFENVSIRNNRNIRLRGVGGAPDYITVE